MAAPKSGRCGFFVEKKKRFCKLEAARGRAYCGEHAHMEEGGGATRRVTCPLDPKHSVSAEKLQQHLKKCNSREKPPPVYFVKNRNSGSADEDEVLSKSLSDRTDLDSLIDKLKAATEGLSNCLDERVLSHPVLQGELSNPKNGDSAHKHLRQQSSILGHLEDLSLLSAGQCFVEFGAGRGKLAHWILEALKTPKDQETPKDLQMLLVERCTTRFKVDGKHQDSGVELERLQVDIQHLDLGKVPMVQKKKLPLVAVGKHLCGAATDLAIRCLLETSEVPEPTEPLPKRQKSSDLSENLDPEPGPGLVPGLVLGLVLALCCHHRCEWRHYVGKRFFRDRGLGPDEFAAFCRMSSWATCGLRDQNQDHDHKPNQDQETETRLLSAAERHHVGHLCKRLLDAGRRDFLTSRGLTCGLWRYVQSDVTLENVLLTAVSHRPATQL
ncbi:unnamed protein product [Ophioblennius macclurei]